MKKKTVAVENKVEPADKTVEPTGKNTEAPAVQEDNNDLNPPADEETAEPVNSNDSKEVDKQVQEQLTLELSEKAKLVKDLFQGKIISQ